MRFKRFYFVLLISCSSTFTAVFDHICHRADLFLFYDDPPGFMDHDIRKQNACKDVLLPEIVYGFYRVSLFMLSFDRDQNILTLDKITCRDIILVTDLINVISYVLIGRSVFLSY